MTSITVIIWSIVYMAILFWIAYYTEKKSEQGKSLVNNAYIYSLSLAIYCTAWTFFGSVGKATNSGIDFLPIYLGPTIMCALWWFVLKKIIVISKAQRITSIADFISSRYGKSIWLGVIATIIAIFSIIPYISIQLKAITFTYEILTQYNVSSTVSEELPIYSDTAFYITIVLAVFTIFFGTRKLDPNERHEGLVAAVAFESVLKLIAFIAIGLYVTFGVFNGVQDVFITAQTLPIADKILSLKEVSFDGWSWFWLTLLSMFAVIFLPRQFHIAVVENTNPAFVEQASWIFPLYLFVINIFVLPIAIGGIYLFGDSVNPDSFVLNIPMMQGKYWLALFVGLGGFAAATSMVIVAVIALSIMVSNNLILPFLLSSTEITHNRDITERLVGIRRVCIIVVLLLAYGYFRAVSNAYTIVSIGLISFTGIVQFAPVVLGGIFWKRGTKAGAKWALIIGFLVWGFCLPLPTMAEVDIIRNYFIEQGLMGYWFLKPYSLFGLEGLDHISHGAFWSLLFNIIAYVGVSLNTQPSILEISQADFFVDIYKYQNTGNYQDITRRRAKMADIKQLMVRFLGKNKTQELLHNYQRTTQRSTNDATTAREDFIRLAETHLAGAIGAASARIILNSIVKTDPIKLNEIFKILEQTQEIIEYSKQLEHKSMELEATTHQLKEANEQLKALDQLKADFITTVTHELRTPITSIKALTKILYDNPDLSKAEQQEYLGIIVSESERITRLINQVLDLEKLQRMTMPQLDILDIVAITKQSLRGVNQLMLDKSIDCQLELPNNPIWIKGVSDRLVQAIVNLLSNAIKFCPDKNGKIEIVIFTKDDSVLLKIKDNGIGILPEHQSIIFDKFAQVSNQEYGKPKGTGLGLPITKEIVERHQGTISVNSKLNEGATFIIELPLINY